MNGFVAECTSLDCAPFRFLWTEHQIAALSITVPKGESGWSTVNVL